MKQKSRKEQPKNEEKCNYPSACYLVDSCFQDYQRVQENYNKLYDKVYYALCLVGVVLTLMLGSFDLKCLQIKVDDLKIWELVYVFIEVACMILGFILIIIATIKLVLLLKSREVTVFNSVDVRLNEIYKETNENAAMWLIDKYTQATNDMRPIINKKQKTYDRILIMLIVGIIVYVIGIVLQKGGL